MQITPATEGTWEALPKGGRLWRLRVHAPGATDLNFGFTTFAMPPGATLHVVSESVDYYEGPYDTRDEKPHGELWTPVVPGERAVLEVYVPPGESAEPDLVLEQIGVGFRGLFFGVGDPKSGSCNNDVVCPVADEWRDEIRSVAAYSRGGSLLCTGTLIMDVPGDFRPFFLTANHCGVDSGNAASVVVFWNFESPTCGQQDGGSLSDNQTGAVLRAAKADVDFTLIELDELPDSSFRVHYAGWDASGATPPGSVGIHHPNGDEKSISFNTDPLTTSNSCIGTGGSTHWRVDDWEDGTTEPGSSGSGIWDPVSHRLVGFLSGGISACPENNGSDCYGKFSVAWASGSTAAQRLRDWLDPEDTGVTGVSGSDPLPAIALSSFEGADICPGTPANENGVWEPGEEILLPVALVASGAFTGVQGTLSSDTPGVSIVRANAVWPDLIEGVPAQSLPPHFSIRLGQDVECSTSISFQLAVTAAEGGPFMLSSSMPVGDLPTPDVPKPVPDQGSAESTLEIISDSTISDVNVRVDIRHSFVGDLRLRLQSPTGTEVVLLDRPGVPASANGCGNDDLNVTFDDASQLVLEGHCAGTAPWFQGPAMPVGSLAAFNGESSVGTWRLIVDDSVGQDTGVLAAWDLLLTPASSGVCARCPGGSCGDAGAPCDDGSFCNGAERCQAGICRLGVPPCPSDACEEAIDTCEPFCGDGQASGAETCGEPGLPACPAMQACRDCGCVSDEVPGDHYVCYRSTRLSVPPGGAFVPQTRVVKDIFEEKTFDLTGIASECAPALKTVDGTVFSPMREKVFFTDYSLSLRGMDPPQAPFSVAKRFVEDQFGVLSLRLRRPTRALIQSRFLDLGEIRACGSGDECLASETCMHDRCIPKRLPAMRRERRVPGVDDFKCYPVRVRSETPYAPRTGVRISERVGGSFLFDVLKPVRLCVPADVDLQSPGAETHPGLLLCHKLTMSATEPVQAVFPGRTIAVRDSEFSRHILGVSSPAELCVPAAFIAP